MNRNTTCLTLAFALIAAFAWADGPQDNIPDKVRRIPKLGVEVPAEKRKSLETGLKQLAAKIDALRQKKDSRVQSLLPDVQIYHRAVSDALRYQEFFRAREIDVAVNLLKAGDERATQLLSGEAPWTNATGLVVRGYVSKIDGSVQPYGLVIPKSYTHQTAGKYRLDLWFHGRGETLSEVNFLSQRSNQVGQFAPADTIVLHPYGRYSNAFKFAGEVDVLEALDSARSRYRVDDDRIASRGFSMGGAACWQFAVHYADRWFAANPGAGFSETPEFLKFFQKETLNPPWYEEKLWRMYDCNLWAENLVHCPTVAYSGEIDRQKQAADIMEAALAKLNIPLTHIIGPKTGHRYHPEAKATVTRLLDEIAHRGRQNLPREVRLTTYTLKYNRMHWVTIDGMGEHWEKARVQAKIHDDAFVNVATENVTDLTLAIPAGSSLFRLGISTAVNIDGQKMVGKVATMSDQSWTAPFHKVNGQWKAGKRPEAGLRKVHDLQGPIDDAFMDSFIFVRSTGKADSEKVGAWARSEMDRAVEHWRRHFRGHARIVDDVKLTEQQIASSNLVLWGDPNSNKVMSRIVDRLPIRWNTEGIAAGDQRFDSENHALVAIYPNPLNPKRYVVLNSGFTYREFAYLNNARQTPKLPDWAVVDLRTPPGTQWPGKIVAADFFDEKWQLKPTRK